MKKSIFVLSAFVIVVFASCQKEYVCFCSNTNTGQTINSEQYTGTIFAKKTAESSCKDFDNLLVDTLDNCHIK